MKNGYLLYALCLCVYGTDSSARPTTFEQLEYTAPASESQANLDRELLRAASLGDAHGVRQALRKGAQPNSVESLNGEETALMLAVKSGSYDTVEAMVEGGASLQYRGHLNVDSRTVMDNMTALALAVKNGNARVSRYMIDRGAQLVPPATVKKLDDYGKVQREVHPLITLAPDSETMAVLLDAGADSNVVFADGSTLITHARARGDTATTNLLLQHGAVEPQIFGGDHKAGSLTGSR